jgi:hypothetical protein
MGHILPGFKRNDQGGITTRLFDSDSFPKEDGWYDAPDKVPPLIRMGQVVPDPARPEVRTSPSEYSISQSHGTYEARPYGSLSPKQAAAIVKPRVNGRFVKAN